ncbi:MAG: glutamyl-tRNA reductase [Clostridium sp.]|nr:glutamyl-tRNA reductase [Clostridium sp.]
MYCISVSYKKAPAEIRGRFAFDAREKEALAGMLRESGAAEGCVVLCTCNRSEVYLSGGKAAIRALQEAVASIKAVPQQELLKYLNIYSGDRATAHLFKVCCGFDSMVLGEDEILGQVRLAYQAALEKKDVNYELNVLFQRAIACAKRIRTDTRISTTPLSVATLVANEVFRFPKDGVKQVMIIGITGKMGTTIAKNILAKPGIQVTGTVRSHHAVLDFAPKGDRVRLVDYRDRYKYAKDMDIVISATTSPHYTITMDELNRALAGDSGERRLLVDVAVPLDMDPEAAKLPGVTLRDIDYFDTLSRNNEQIRLKELDRARAIMEEDLDGAVKEMMFHPYISRLAQLRAAFAGKSPESLLFTVRDRVSSEELKVVLKVLDGLERWVKEE